MQILWGILTSILGAVLAAWLVGKILGGSTLLLFPVFFLVLVMANREVWDALVRASGQGGAFFRWLKSLVFAAVAAVVLLFLLSILSGKPLEAWTSRMDTAAFLIGVSLLGLFAAWQAGWTRGEWGKRATVWLFTLTLLGALVSSKLPALPGFVGYKLNALNDKLVKLSSPPIPVICPGQVPLLREGEVKDFRLGSSSPCLVMYFRYRTDGEIEQTLMFLDPDGEPRLGKPQIYRRGDPDLPLPDKRPYAVKIRASKGRAWIEVS